MSRCLSCNVALSDMESVRKYSNHENIKKSEDKYIGLCTRCLKESGLEVEDLFASEEILIDEVEE